MGCHFCDQVMKDHVSLLADPLSSCLLRSHALMKWIALLENPTWQRTEGGLWLTASEELNSANDHMSGLEGRSFPS